MHPAPAPSLTDRLFLAGIRRGPLEPLAVRALNKAVHLLSLAVGQHLQNLRASDDPLLQAQGRIEEQTALLCLTQEMAALLGERWDKIPDKTRPHYTPTQRFRILRVRQLLGLSTEEAARAFRVAPGTIARWIAELNGDPEKTAIGAVGPCPPLRRYADVVQHTVQTMALLGFRGYDHIAQSLARVGWRLSRSTVARYLKKPKPAPTPDEPMRKTHPVTARFVHHTWMMDLTVVRSLFGLNSFTVAAVLDVYSHSPWPPSTGNQPQRP